MKFVDTLLLGIAKNNFHAVLAYFFIQKKLENLSQKVPTQADSLALCFND